MHALKVALPLLVVLVVAVSLTAAGSAKPVTDGAKNGDEADPDADFTAIQEALNEYRGDNSDEAYEAFTEAAHAFLDNHPDDPRVRQAQVLLMQMMNIHEDWQGLLDYTQSIEDDVADSNEMLISVLGNMGRAHANLGNREEAEAIVVRLRTFEVENHQQLSQAQREASEIERLVSFLPGNPAPDFSLPTIDDEGEVSLEDLEDQYVLLVFNWAGCTDCQHLKSQVLKPLWEKYREKNFVVVSVGLDTAEAQRDATEEHGYDWTLLYDPEHDIVREYGVRGVPHVTLIDPEQKFVLVGTGSDASDGLEEALEEAFGNDADEETDAE